MEPVVERALFIQRFNYHQMQKIHELERERGSMVWSEANHMFKLGSTFEHWGITRDRTPEAEKQRHAYAKRVRSQLRDAGCLSGFDVSPVIYGTMMLPEWHEFDLRVQKALEAGKLNFFCEKELPKSSSLAAVMEDEDRILNKVAL